MPIKYVYVLSERLPGYGHIFPHAHAPLDRAVIERLQCKGLPDDLLPKTVWSRIDEYEEYSCIQEWIRDSFSGSCPLSVEFHLWL